MKLIVGLGNIGREYENTRHNIGFMALDALADRENLTFKMDSAHHAMIADWRYKGEKILLVKPTTYMNESGRAVGPLMKYYNLENEDVLVIHDDMDMDLGRLRLRATGSAGGHNGIKSLIQVLGTKEFTRLKFGISHPKYESQAVIDFVLGKFTKDEMPEVMLGIDRTIEIIEGFGTGEKVQMLMNRFN